MSGRSTRHRVLWGETDAAAIVYYPNYFRWFDQASHELLEELGCSVSTIMKRGYVVPIVEAKGRFFSSLLYQDELYIESRIAEIRTRAFRVEHRVSRGGELACEGYEVRMWVREAESGRGFVAEVIPEDVRALLAGGGA